MLNLNSALVVYLLIISFASLIFSSFLLLLDKPFACVVDKCLLIVSLLGGGLAVLLSLHILGIIKQYQKNYAAVKNIAPLQLLFNVIIFIFC